MRSATTGPLSVEVWSDVVCPWCRIGRSHLETALTAFEHSPDVEVTWRSYELDRRAPAVRSESIAELLVRATGEDDEEVATSLASMTRRGADLGLEFRFDLTRSGNSFDAHRLLHLARGSGMQGALKERLFRGYFAEGEAIGDPEALERLAVEAGLDRVEVRDVLGSDRFAADVRADEVEAEAIQISGVPYFVIDRRYAVPGAQSAERLLGVLRQAWAERVAS